MRTDTSEKGLESLIVTNMTAPGVGWILGDAEEYDREYAVDLVQLRAFIAATQSPLLEVLDLDVKSPVRRKFLDRLQGEITKQGVIHVLRHGLKHGAHHIDFFTQPQLPAIQKLRSNSLLIVLASRDNFAIAKTKQSLRLILLSSLIAYQLRRLS